MTAKRFQDKVVIITGAAGGIGRAAALRFASEGASIMAVDRDEAGLAETASVVAELGGASHTMSADGTNDDEVQNFVAETVAEFGLDRWSTRYPRA